MWQAQDCVIPHAPCHQRQPCTGLYLPAAALQAYAATDNSQWGVNSSNWCCVNAAVGCPPPVQPRASAPRPSRTVYPLAKCRGNPVVRASRLCQAMSSDVIAAVCPSLVLLSWLVLPA